MIYEWFLIGLPVVFLLGWFAARLDIRHIRKTAGELPRAYLHGLSHLLRGEKNRALDWFLRAQPLDPESAELQFAIGELLRTRGEHRRALKTHLALCERESLGAENRLRARWELACDYFQMGFFDLAEKHAAPLAEPENTGYRELAGDMLLDICQRANDYERALAVLDNMPIDASLIRRRTRAHLLCELAARDRENAEKLLTDAHATDGRCARANLLLGDIAMSAGRHEDAAKYYREIEGQNTDYLWCAVPGVMAAAKACGREETGDQILLSWLKAHPSPMLFDAVYRQLSACGRAKDLATDGICNGIGLLPVAAWAGEQLRTADDSKRDFWKALERTVAGGGWRCDNCDYQTGDFVWQCHNCLSWESFRHQPR